MVVLHCPPAERHIWLCLSQELGEELVFAKPNIYFHFAQGLGDPKYLPVPSWPALNKLLGEALDGYNEVNAAMSLVSAAAPTAATPVPWVCTSWGICCFSCRDSGCQTSPPVFSRCSLKTRCLIFAELVES